MYMRVTNMVLTWCVNGRGCWQDLRAHWGSMASPPVQPQPSLTSSHPQPLAVPPSQSGKAYLPAQPSLLSVNMDITLLAKLHGAPCIPKFNVCVGRSHAYHLCHTHCCRDTSCLLHSIPVLPHVLIHVQPPSNP